MKKRFLFLLLPFLFISKVNALTQCGSQGIEYDNKTMPMVVFLGNAASSGYEIQNYAFSDSSQSALNWSFNSFQQLCQKVSGSMPSTFNYITFRISNYTYLKGNIYSIVFSFTDTNAAWNIQQDSASNQNLSWARILTSKSDLRDKIMYLTVVFEALENYSGTANFVFYTSSINTSDFVGLTEHFYTPYITSVPSVPDNSAQLNNIENLQQNTLNSVQNVQSQVSQVQEQITDIDGTLKDDNTQGAQDSAGGFFNDFTTDTHGLTAIITAPLSLISSITSSSCSPLVLPLPFVDKDLTLPCMGVIYSNYFGSFLSIYQVITFGIIAYWVCVRIFNLVKDFKNPDHDEIEVLDL